MGSIPSIVAEREQLAQIDGSDAAPDGDTGGLRVQSALPAGIRPLPARAARPAAGRQRHWPRAGCMRAT